MRNLSPEVSEHQLCELFSFNNMLQVQRVKKINNFAFIHYDTHQDAEWALNQTKGKITIFCKSIADNIFHYRRFKFWTPLFCVRFINRSNLGKTKGPAIQISS